MKAFQVLNHAHPSQISVSQDVPTPIPAPDQVLVDVYAAGLNFFDILQAQGKYQTQPPLPFVLGAEFAGRISAHSPIPKGCRWRPGDRVFGYAQGSFAEVVAVGWKGLLGMPAVLGFEEAAGVSLTYTTSYEGLVGRGAAKKGDWVLVHAGAGGVGLAACQIAKVLGCKVIATASTEEKRRVCRDRGGVDEVVDYTQADWQKEVMRITGGKGVDVVFDPVGMIVPSLKCIAWNGRLVVVGFAGGTIEKIPANLLLLKNVSATGLFWGATATKDPPRVAKVVKEVLGLIASGKLVPQVYDPVYVGLEEVPKGLQELEGRKTWGKAVVRIREDRAKL
ncbi:NADPH:quinone reductase, partial [Tremellales sp. Uapishka_1]